MNEIDVDIEEIGTIITKLEKLKRNCSDGLNSYISQNGMAKKECAEIVWQFRDLESEYTEHIKFLRKAQEDYRKSKEQVNRIYGSLFAGTGAVSKFASYFDINIDSSTEVTNDPIHINSAYDAKEYMDEVEEKNKKNALLKQKGLLESRWILMEIQ